MQDRGDTCCGGWHSREIVFSITDKFAGSTLGWVGTAQAWHETGQVDTYWAAWKWVVARAKGSGGARFSTHGPSQWAANGIGCLDGRNSLCEGSGDVVGVLTLLVGGVAQAFHDDRVVELRVQLGVEEVEGKRQGGTSRSRKWETSQRGCAMESMEMVMTRLRTWANEVWDDIKCERLRSTCTLNARCAPRNCRGQHRQWCRALWAACNCACSRHSTLLFML